MAEEFDTGDIIDQKAVHIGNDDTIADILPRVTEVYLEILENNLYKLISGDIKKVPQDQSKATYTCKRLPSDNLIHWESSTGKIYDLIRGVTHPYHGAYCYLRNQKITIWSAEKIPSPPRYVGRACGRVIEVIRGVGVKILTGDGVLLLKNIQLENEVEQNASEVINNLNITLE